MTTKEKILKEYKNKKNWIPPSYGWIAKKVGCSKAYVAKIVTGSK